VKSIFQLNPTTRATNLDKTNLVKLGYNGSLQANFWWFIQKWLKVTWKLSSCFVILNPWRIYSELKSFLLGIPCPSTFLLSNHFLPSAHKRLRSLWLKIKVSMRPTQVIRDTYLPLFLTHTPAPTDVNFFNFLKITFSKISFLKDLTNIN